MEEEFTFKFKKWSEIEETRKIIIFSIISFLLLIIGLFLGYMLGSQIMAKSCQSFITQIKRDCIPYLW